ncbi:MAG: ABC transporter ATP-binding protein [Comamonadaceae bacterium CG2_30_60_41]|nr:MAG: ABC transporter ATP-binding protein [Comamonadaceae bacterium CG2_30_60_41]PIW08243.1 MAG: ABC transporter ATP-binding protein [Comamonadaceae bacterium CG17_big_fil_post_rev_8_21_14_2_50_60_13]PIY24332.1 MAG: ABC transporter ATP-binding protein [Comamonadaceae bacterium CG_4_10_14_3_um_filter_60_75]
MANIVELHQIRKSYGEGTPVATEVLHGLDLAIAEGEFAALTGPSGSGKSTLLNIIGLLERASSGELRIDGQDTAQLNDAALTALRGRTIGFIFQFHHLLPAFTALENVMMPAIIDSGWATAKAQDQALRLLDQVGLKDALHKRPAQLSGGMQQRVAIARALSLSPRLILADEPTGNLDTHSANDIFELLESVNHTQQSACLIVTHDPRLAARCQRQIQIVDGQLLP